MKRVLLTGAAGAIGVHVLADLMHHTDWHVICLDSFEREHKGYYDRIARVCRNHLDWNARFTIFQHDLRAPVSSRQVEQLGKIDYIFNLASRSDVQNSIDDPLPFVKNNTDMMLNMVELARDLWGLRNGNTTPPEGTVFLHFSTDEVYGPAPKDSAGHPEWDVILPSNPYSASKACQEAIAIGWWRSFGLPLILTNTMNNFGEMQAPSKFPAMIQQYIEEGKVVKVHSSKSGEIGTRYYIHSRNSAHAMRFIVTNVPVVLHSHGEIDRPVRLNIVGDRQVSNLELPQIISKLMDKPVVTELSYFHDDNPGHDLHYGLDGKKLKGLGWESPLDFETSLKNTIDWQTRNPEWMKSW